ncbi:hypothetical protein LOK49_LG04G02687 [Camellia lanceoleosa]|uniref:Uncharacterized protein n=1 Tax=Camellia lanceoleosa TaxID=1840588 RepID=A0ACC0HY72_9ERIC|nr:hypothetical protein LOK49_LG04G02687 [Camellia lanceoleosa]
MVYLENSSRLSLSDSNASTGENSRKTRQLTEESAEHLNTVSNTTNGTGDRHPEEKNPIRQVTEQGHKPGLTDQSENREQENVKDKMGKVGVSEDTSTSTSNNAAVNLKTMKQWDLLQVSKFMKVRNLTSGLGSPYKGNFSHVSSFREYLYIGAALFTVIFCIIEIDKPSEPHNFEPQIYNMERGARDKLITDYNTMDLWEFNEKYGDLWDFTVKNDDIMKR